MPDPFDAALRLAQEEPQDVPLIVQLTRQFQASLDARNSAAMQQMAAEWLKVEDRLRAEIELLAAELASPPGQPLKLDPVTEMVVRMREAGYAPDRIQQLLASQGIFKIPDIPQPQAKELKAWQLAKLQRYVRLLAQVQQEIERFTGQTATPVIDQLLADSAFAGLEDALTLINATITASGGNAIDFGFDRLGIEAVQNIVAVASAGKPLGDLLQAAYPLAAGGITDRLIYGTAAGWNPRKTARAIINEGLAQGLNHILLVARDQQVRNYREASRQQYLKSGVVQQYRRLAARQSRSCLACLALDGTIQDVAELMALHPQDRCSIIPLVPGFDPIPTESGEAWFNRQPAEVQRRMMGPGRYNAWKAGKFKFNQLATIKPNATWGPSAQVTPLKDLLKGRGGFTPATPPEPQPIPTPGQTQPLTGPAARKLIEAMSQESQLAQYRTQIADQERLAEAAFKAGDVASATALLDQSTEVLVQLRQAEEEVKTRIRENLLYVQTPATFQVNFASRFNRELKARYQVGLDAFARMVGLRTLDGQTVQVKARRGGGRAYYDRMAIVLSRGTGERVVIHEAGHWLEDLDPEVHRKALEFYDRRTQGEQVEWLGPGYSRWEVTRRDKFLSDYMGKEYKDRRGERYATEIISMGMEYMWDDPVRLATEDPDYFDFIFEVLRG
jgi:hypothetical protein